MKIFKFKETIWTTANLPQQAKSVISPIDGPVHQPVTHTKPEFFNAGDEVVFRY